MKKQSFVAGAAILMAANAVSKILGAVFKIPLTYILHEEGMAVFNVAFQVYIMILTFIISGFPPAVSKNVSEALSCSNTRHAHNIVRTATLILAAAGALGSIILYAGAEFFAALMKEEKAVIAIKCISPSVFFVALGTGCKSYYQGASNMIPTAVSQVIEAVIKLAAGYMLAASLVSLGTEATAGGAIFGVTAGEIVATAMLCGMYMFGSRHEKLYYERGERRQTASELMHIAAPILCAAVLSNVISFADTAVVRMRLLDAGLCADKARYLYGAYTGYALTVFHLPAGILATLGVSILPVISGALAADNGIRARKAALSGIRLTIYLSVPFAVVMYMLPSEILTLLFGNDASAYMLKLAAPCVVMLCVSQITAAVMQAAGHITAPIIYMFIGSLIKLAVSYVLTGMPEFNMYGEVLAMDISYLIVMTINFAAAGKFLCLKYDIMSIIIKPAAAAAAMYAVIRLAKEPLCAFNGTLGLFAVCAAGCTAYMLVILLTGAVKSEEIVKMIR